MVWDKENRMEYWYPKIPDSIPKPKTSICLIIPHWTEDGNNMTITEEEFNTIESECENYDFPLFMRGSETSGKHDWKNTCFVETKEEIREKVIALIEDAMLKDIGCSSIVIREFIEMKTGFYAFRNMPVNPERRYFMKDGKVVCHHPYWIEDSIRNPDLEHWKEILKELNKEDSEEIKLLKSYSEEIGKNFEGFWSIDFCKSRDGAWYLIDMALGEDSWHPDCSHKPSSKSEKKHG